MGRSELDRVGLTFSFSAASKVSQTVVNKVLGGIVVCLKRA